MKIFAIAMVLCWGGNAMSQPPSFEKQALTLVQHTLASGLDEALPKLTFMTWFSRLVGPHAGVIWQLTECGEPLMTKDNKGEDLRACMEVNASLLDGRKVVVAIAVGTFKNGITGKPAFFQGAIERDQRFYPARRLSDLPEMLSSPAALEAVQFAPKKENLAVKLPVVSSDQTTFRLHSEAVPLLPQFPSLLTGNLVRKEIPPPPVISPPVTQAGDQGSKSAVPAELTDLGATLESKAITRVKPVYPPMAQKLNAFGTVKVVVTISETGKIIKAQAISGHLALRGAAVEAAYKWVFKPMARNGTPVKMQGILTFDFTPGSQ